MEKCLTKPLVFRKGSGCLVEKPECGFAHKFGFSYVCHHPEHTKFNVHASGATTKNELEKQYSMLRQKRRVEFVASLDETSREYFCLQTDFFGQPLTQ